MRGTGVTLSVSVRRSRRCYSQKAAYIPHAFHSEPEMSILLSAARMRCRTRNASNDRAKYGPQETPNLTSLHSLQSSHNKVRRLNNEHVARMWEMTNAVRVQNPRVLVGRPQENRPLDGPGGRRHGKTKRDTESVRTGFRWLRIGPRCENEESMSRKLHSYISTVNTSSRSRP